MNRFEMFITVAWTLILVSFAAVVGHAAMTWEEHGKMQTVSEILTLLGLLVAPMLAADPTMPWNKEDWLK